VEGSGKLRNEEQRKAGLRPLTPTLHFVYITQGQGLYIKSVWIGLLD